MAGLHFDITGDNSNFIRKLQEVENGVRQTSRQIEQSGLGIEELFGRMTRAAVNISTSAHSFNELEAAIRKAGAQIKDMDFGTVQEKIGALSYMIQQNEAVIAENVSMLEKWKQDAETAFASGDTGTLDTITRDIDEQIAKIDQLTQETEGYRSTLQAVMEISGMGSQEVSVPRLYDSEEDMQHVEELRQKIIETTAEISKVGADGGDTSALVVSLSAMKDELNGCETSAAQAAAALGQDLGGRAAEAQQSLHSLNTAIDEQQEKINTITAALEEARANYEALQQSESATSDEVERAAATYDTLSETLRNAQSEMIALQTAQQTAQNQWNNVSEEIKTHDSIMVKMLGGYENYSAIISKLPGPVQSVIGGIQGMTGAAKAFIATPLGAIIAAIVLALQTLSTWFNSSVEGQMKFAEISGYVSGVLGQLKEIVITVGKAIFKAFSDPKQAISDFWEALKTNVVNRFKSVGVIAASLGKVIKAAFTLDMDGVKSGIKELMNGFLQFGTGVENVTDKVSAWAKGVHNAAAETATIARESKELEIEVSKWQKRNQELEKQKTEARGKMYNTSLSTSERRKAQKDFEAALQEQYEAEAKFADKRVELQERTMALTTNGIEDENKLRDLQAARLAVDTNRAQQLASLQRRAGALNNTDNSSAQKREQALVSLGQMEAQLILDNEKRKLELMDEGHEKRLKQIAQQGDEELAALEKLKAKMVKANKEAGVTDVNAAGLTAEQQKEINKAKDLNIRMMDKNINDLYKPSIDEYRSYTDQRLAIEKKFNDDINTLQKARKMAEAQGNTEEIARIDRSIAKATADKGKALMSHDFEVLKQSPEYIRAFEDLKNTSSETLKSLLSQLENAKQTAAQTLNPEDLREYTTTIQEIMDELDARNPFQALADRKRELADAERELADAKRRLDAVRSGAKIVTSISLGEDGKIKATYLSAADALKKYNEAKDKHEKANNKFIKAEKTAREKVDELADAIKGIGDAIGGQAGEIISLIGDVALFATSTIDGIDKVTRTGAEAISAVKKASVILGIISTAIQLFQKISELGNNKAFKQYEAYAEKIKEINALTDAVNEYRIAALEARQAEESWFSEDNLKSLRDYKKLHDEVYATYVEKATESQAIYKNKSGGGWLTGAFNWLMGNLSVLSWWDKWKNIWGQGDYDKGQTAAINNLRIETRKRSKGFLGTGIGGHSQKTEDLVTWARNQGLGELFDDKGLINKELAQSLIENYGNKLVGQTKETLEALIELREKYDEYMEQLHEYVSSLYEPLVDNFVDSLWDWLDNGKDALDSFKDYASDTFRDIVSDMMRTIVLDKVVDGFDEKISDLYEKYASGEIDEQDLMKKVAEETGNLMNRYEQTLPTLENILSTVYGHFDNAGIDLKQSESSERTATAKGIAQASQDSVNELNARFTTIQGHTYSISENMVRLAELQQTQLPFLQNLSYLAPIEENTYYCRRLDGMDTDLRAIKQTLENIELKGITVKA